MIVDKWREGFIDDIDEYDAVRDNALKSAHPPPPHSEDIRQLIEAYADSDSDYDFEHPEENHLKRALHFWSDTFCNAMFLRDIIQRAIIDYNEFDAVKTVELLTSIYPDAYFLAAREYSVAIYVFSQDGNILTKPTEAQEKALKVDEVFYYPIQRHNEVPTGIIRFWWH